MKKLFLALLLLCVAPVYGVSGGGSAAVPTLVATATPIPAVATATPIPAVDTATPIPAVDTATPIPAPTLVSTATPIPAPAGLTVQMGELWISSAAETTIASANVWAKVAGTSTLRMNIASDDDGGTDNRLRYTGSARIMSHNGATLSMDAAGTNVDIFAAMVKQFDLATNALTTVGIGLSTIDITWPGHDVDTIDVIVLSGATAFDGITAAQLNVNHTVTSIPDVDTIRITVSSDTATAGSVSGGGSAIDGAIVLISSKTQFFIAVGSDTETTAVHSMSFLNQSEGLEIWISNDTNSTNITIDTLNLFSVGISQ